MHKNWSKLTPMQRVAAVLVAILQYTLLGVALWDIRHRSDDELKGGKKLWTGLVFINWIGPIAYFLVGRKP